VVGVRSFIYHEFCGNVVYSSEINLKLNLWEDYVSPVVIALWLLFSSESLFQPNNTSRLELFSQLNELFEFENEPFM